MYEILLHNSMALNIIFVVFLQVKMHRDYSKKKVYETEHGVCQMCGLDANQLYNRIKLVILIEADYCFQHHEI